MSSDTMLVPPHPGGTRTQEAPIDAIPTCDAEPAAPAPRLDGRTLRDAFGRFATGVAVVGFRGPDGRPTGVTVSAFSSLGPDPPLCLLSLSRPARHRGAGPGLAFLVLERGQEAPARRLATPARDGFERLAVSRAP